MATNVNDAKSAYYLKLPIESQKRYDEKIEKCGGLDPYTIKPKDLSTYSRDFPKMTMSNIVDYMIYSVSPFSHQFSENYKGTEAYKYFESGFVLNIGSKKMNNSAIVKGKVKHSQKMNETPLQVWVFAHLEGEIIFAHCTCVAGLSETCSHVGAICFAISEIAASEETKSVTEILCKWNVPSFKEVAMSSASKITWKLTSHKQASHDSSFLEYCDSVTPLSEDRIKEFVFKCRSAGDDTALETIIFPDHRKRKSNLRDEIFLANLYISDYQNKSLSELIEIGKSMSLNLSADESQEISNITSSKFKTQFSLALRRGRITDSNFKSCCLENINDPSLTNIMRVLSPIKHLCCVPNFKYHLQNKNKALQQYNSLAELHHANFINNESGLVIIPNLPYFAGTVDGCISCLCHGNGCIVIKCVQIDETDTLGAYLTRKPNNILNKYGNSHSLNESHDFFHEVQFKINITNAEYCDCIFWSSRKAFVVRAKTDIGFFNKEMEKALAYHERVIMPELLGKFYTGKLANTMDENYDEEPADYSLIELEIERVDEEELGDSSLIELEIEQLNEDVMERLL